MPNASAIQLIDAPARGNGTDWSEDAHCRSLSITSNLTLTTTEANPCLASQPPALCTQWDFFSGDDPRNVRVPKAGVAIENQEWQIFETGGQTFEKQGPCEAEVCTHRAPDG